MSLQIFEPRYLTMVSQQMKSGSGFGVVQIREGREVGGAPLIFPVGTEVEIVDWNQRPNGLLGLVIEGRRRFKVCGSEIQPDQLMTAEIEWLAEEDHSEDEALLMLYDGLADILDQLRGHPAVASLNFAPADTASQLGWQLSQLMPLSLPEKMALWELRCSEQRLEQLAAMITRLSEE